MVMITAVGLSNKYLNRPIGSMFRNVSLVISFTTVDDRMELGNGDSGSVADYSVCFEMLRRAYSILIVM